MKPLNVMQIVGIEGENKMFDKIIEWQEGHWIWLSDVCWWEDYIGWIDTKGEKHLY